MKTLEGELVYSQKDSGTFVFHIMSCTAAHVLFWCSLHKQNHCTALRAFMSEGKSA